MESISTMTEFFIHINRHLYDLCISYGVWVYGLLFLIVFCETGLVVTPLLPGDSLLFAVGSLAAIGVLDVRAGATLLILAAVLGDTVNYWIGKYLGYRLFREPHARFLKMEYLYKTEAFYRKHGGKTIVIARFLPIIRTFAPFVAGIGRMSYPRFILFNVAGAVLWVTLFIFGGYFFGNLPFIRKNFALVILAIIIFSVLPSTMEFIKGRIDRSRKLAS